MVKKISRIFTAMTVTVFIFLSSLAVSGADNYKSWLQSDSRWGNKTLGSCGDTMAEIGCAVTSIAMQVVHSGCKSESEFNPGTLVDYLSKNGGFDSYGNLYWGAVTGMVSNFTFEKRAYFSSQTKSGITQELASYINQGYYIVMSVKYDGHWIAIDTIKNGVVYMLDPAQNKSNNLFDYYDVNGMLQVRLYKGKNTPEKVEINETKYLTGHYQTTDALNLRKSYSTSSDVLLTIPSGKTVVVTRVYNNQWGETEYNGKTGWIFLEYTKYTESSYTYKTGYYKCNATTGVNMRNGIGTDKTIVCLIPNGASVTISSVTANWGKAKYGSKSGYVCMEYMKYVSPVTTAAPKTTTATTTTKITTTSVKTTTTTTTSCITTVTTLPPIIKGDINRDGKIDNEDVLVLNIYFNKPYELEFIEKYIFDVNNDNEINNLDVVYLMKIIRQ